MDSEIRALVTGKVCPTCDMRYSPDLERCPKDNSLLAVVKRDPFTGRIIANKYKIIEIIGMGGFSTVYKAEQESLRRCVAIKILHAELVDKPDKIRRFQREAELISTLVHSNVASVFDYGVLPEGQPYLVMELAEGRTLSTALAESGPFEVERAVRIFLETCEGISAAHGKGLIHRDIKPSNIVLVDNPDGNEHVKVLDFGLAKAITDEDGLRDNLTMTGEVLGTPAYMSPEQCMGTTTDARTDIYSFGCVMHEMLSGKLPLDGDTTFAVMNQHINSTPASLSKCRSDIPPRLVRIVSKTLQKDPDDRFQSFDELKDALLGVEPTLTSEIKSILFSGSRAKLSKKKQALRKRLLLSAWAFTLSTVGVGALLTYENIETEKKKEIESHYKNKIARLDCGTVAFDYPGMFAPVEKKLDVTCVQRFANRVSEDTFFELKFITEEGDPHEAADRQREYHKRYANFIEVKPVQKLAFGLDKRIEGYDTEFVWQRFDGLRRERHAYWGRKGAVWKIKLHYPVSKNSMYQKVYEIIFNTVQFRPDVACTLPLEKSVASKRSGADRSD